jgi:hypothetical protein
MYFKESSANGIRGCLIREYPFDGKVGRLIFRVYSSDKKTFKDYDIAHHDLWITIKDSSASLFEGTENNKIDYSTSRENK